MAGIAPVYDFASVAPKRTISPGSVIVRWTTGGQQYTLTDDSAGNLTGAGNGTVNYDTGQIFINPDPTPAPSDGNYTIEYADWQGNSRITHNVNLNTSGATTFTAGSAIKPGSVRIQCTMRRISKQWRYLESSGKAPYSEYTEETIVLSETASGNLKRSIGSPVFGTVNYATGEIQFDARDAYTYRVYQEKTRLGATGSYFESSSDTATEEYANGVAVISWVDPNDPTTAHTVTRPIPGVTIDLTPNSSRHVVPNSVIFELNGAPGTWTGMGRSSRTGRRSPMLAP